MTEPTKPARKTTARKATAKKAVAPAAGPTVKIMPNGRERLDHSTCDHPRDFKGCQACRAAHKGNGK